MNATWELLRLKSAVSVWGTRCACHSRNVSWPREGGLGKRDTGRHHPWHGRGIGICRLDDDDAVAAAAAQRGGNRRGGGNSRRRTATYVMPIGSAIRHAGDRGFQRRTRI